MKSILSKALKVLIEVLPMCWECLQCIILKRARAGKRGTQVDTDFDTDADFDADYDADAEQEGHNA